MSIVIIGLGLRLGDMTVSAMEEIRKADEVVLRTGECEAAGWLDDNGIKYETFDEMYAAYEDFSVMYDDMAKRLTEMSRGKNVAYGVFDLRDESVRRLSGMQNARLIAGPSVDGELMGYCAGPVTSIAACDIGSFCPKAAVGVTVREIDSRIAASEVKIRLMERFPYDSPVVISARNAVSRTTLDEIDRLGSYDHTVCAYISAQKDTDRLEVFGTDELREAAKAIPNTPVSLSGVTAAIRGISDLDADDDAGVISALGDVTLETCLICEMASRRGRFSWDDVVTSAGKALLKRLKNAYRGQKQRN